MLNFINFISHLVQYDLQKTPYRITMRDPRDKPTSYSEFPHESARISIIIPRDTPLSLFTVNSWYLSNVLLVVSPIFALLDIFVSCMYYHHPRSVKYHAISHIVKSL